MKSAVSLSLLPLLATASALNIETIHKDAAPVLSSANAKEIPNSYMIVFKKHVKQHHAATHHKWVKTMHTSRESERAELRKKSQIPILDQAFEGFKHTFDIAGGLLGYSGHFDDETIEQIRRHPDVEYIEKDSIVHTLGDEPEHEIEKNAPWGLARISNRKALSFANYNKYLYSADGGEGVDVYVIDTGTNTEHVDFEGRAHWGKTIPNGDADEDGNGHGTHCSGTVAGKKYGVAKKANVYAVKVLRSNGSGTMSDVVKGVEYAATQHTKTVKSKKKGFKGSAANMSLGGGKSRVLDLAVNAAVDAGIHFAVAAGNDNADSCNYSPAAAENAVTVGASTLSDERAYFSNFGKCNDIFAPGLNILSTWIGSKHATNTISGTSMASPHIAGLLAYYLSLQPSSDSAYAVAEITPKKLKENLIAIGTKGALSNVPSDTTNILAWNGGGSSNYSDIIKKGSYTVKSTKEVPKIIDLGDMDLSDYEKQIKAAGRKLRNGSSRFERKIEKLAHDLENFIADEVEEVIEAVKAEMH
jgi:cerevisin